ncbi:MAG: hypothetical protein HKN22_04220, partial [Bacteroidia bacterium]|nr:hypothetical protein [Bacteroidia bacterium]
MKPHFSIALLLAMLCVCSATAQINRSYNGEGNNLTNPKWGATHTNQIRITSNAYADSMSAPAGMNRMNARAISNSLMDQPNAAPSYLGLSDYWWSFGQLIDHDLTLVPDDTSEFFPIMVPMGDPVFDSAGTGTQMIPMFRSMHDTLTGHSTNDPRLSINSITSWLDASCVYGSDSVRAFWLRSGVDGRLKVSANDLLPFNTVTGQLNDPIDLTAPEMANENPNITKFFVAGDLRANEQPSLTCLHT